MIRRRIVLLAILLTLTACDSQATPTPRPVVPSPPVVPTAVPPRPAPPPAATLAPTPTSAEAFMMYLAGSNTFFNTIVRDLVRPDLLEQRVAYITPTYLDTKAPVPDEIMSLLARHAAAQGLTRVPREVPGGMVIAVSAIGSAPDETRQVYGREGPTIFFSALIKGKECGSWTSVGYLLTLTATGWKAEQYMQGVC